MQKEGIFFNPKEMKKLLLATMIYLSSCMVPRDVSGNYLVIAKRGHTVMLKGINKRFEIPADKDTVKVGDVIPVVFITAK